MKYSTNFIDFIFSWKISVHVLLQLHTFEVSVTVAVERTLLQLKYN